MDEVRYLSVVVILLACCGCGGQEREDSAVGGAFKVGSVWNTDSEDKDFTLTVIERDGDRFKARFESKGWVRELYGTANGSSVSWKAEDVRVVEGNAGGDNHGTIVSDERGVRIDFEWSSGKKQGTFTLRKQD